MDGAWDRVELGSWRDAVLAEDSWSVADHLAADSAKDAEEEMYARIA